MSRQRKEVLPREYYLPWAGWFPHPELDTDIPPRLRCDIIAEALAKAALSELPAMPAAYCWSVPNGVSLAVFRQAEVECSRREAMQRISGRDLSFEQAARISAALAEIPLPLIVKACTVHGEGRKIKSNKPEDGAMAYIWRMARFHNGTDPTMPTTCYWELEEGIEQRTGLRVSTALISDNVKTILNVVDDKAKQLVLATGGDPLAAAKRWGRALGAL